MLTPAIAELWEQDAAGGSVRQRLYRVLRLAIIRMQFAPGQALSEKEISDAFSVSRQPVRDAFYRLSQQGFLLIRPQRATVVTQISVEAVLQARFVRTALELEIMRAALPNVTPQVIDELGRMIERQREAVADDDRHGFHALDDAFHNRICEIAGHSHVWTLIRDNKAHMDRVRYLSLENGAGLALADHISILEAMAARDEDEAIRRMRAHLSRIAGIISSIRAAHGEYFDPDEPRDAVLAAAGG